MITANNNNPNNNNPNNDNANAHLSRQTASRMRIIRTARTLCASLMIGLITALFLSGAPGLYVQAAESDRERAVALAASNPAFRLGLEARPGWTATAYAVGTKFEVWHVEFVVPGEEDPLGWANVSLKLARVLDLEANYGPTEAQEEAARAVILPFVRGNPDIRALVPTVTDTEIYTWHAWQNLWAAYIDDGANSIQVIILFDNETRFQFTNPKVETFTVPDVKTYAEWHDGKTAEIALIAMKDAALAALLRDHPGWTVEAEPDSENRIWSVSFYDGKGDNQDGKTAFAVAEIDLMKSVVVEFDRK